MTRKLFDYLLLAVFLAGIVFMFKPSGQSPEGLRTTDALWNLGHPVLFFIAGRLVYSFYPGFARRSSTQQILLLVLLVLGAAAATEIPQGLIPGRFPSYTDIVGDLAGAVAYLSFRFRRNKGRYLLLHAAAVCLLIVVLWPPIRSASDEFIAGRQFPILADFETPLEPHRFRSDTEEFEITSQKAYHGSHSLEIHLNTDMYSGISLQYMPRNWTGFSELHFALYNPQPHPITVTLRIHDAEHETRPVQEYTDRFNRSFETVPKTWTSITIPLSDIENAPRTRQLDLTRIQSLGLFVTKAPEPYTLYLDYLLLK